MGTRMWCSKCQCDVVTELAPDNRRVLCATCGSALGESSASQVVAPRSSRTVEARELLDRWANNQLSDPFGPPKKRVNETLPVSEPIAAERPIVGATAEAHVSSAVTDKITPTVSAAPASKPAPLDSGSHPTVGVELDRITNEILARVEKMTRRIEHAPVADRTPVTNVVPTETVPVVPAHPVAAEPPISVATKEMPASESEISPPTVSAPTRRFDEPARASVIEATESESRADSDATTVAETSNSPMKTKKSAVVGNVGQGLAYIGILGITAGFSLVILGSFGGSARWAPTGWLIATIGQMLLFLGVVTLVSAGMEQSSTEVKALLDDRMRAMTERLEFLGQKIIRIEQGRPHAEPRAPYFLANADKADKHNAAQQANDLSHDV